MADPFPLIRDVGLTGKLVTFADQLSEHANRATLAFRAAVQAQDWPGVEEIATSLCSVFIRFDPLVLEHDDLHTRLTNLANTTDWQAEPLPKGRKLWRIPTTLGGAYAPQFDEATAAADLTPDAARDQIANARIRVLTLGFAPGQPYMGQLPKAWNIPRMSTLNPEVPGGALVVAIRQLIIYAGPAPTGWRHIGQTAFRCFRPDRDDPFALTPGDEVTFRIISDAELDQIRATDQTGDGGASFEVLE